MFQKKLISWNLNNASSPFLFIVISEFYCAFYFIKMRRSKLASCIHCILLYIIHVYCTVVHTDYSATRAFLFLRL